MAMRGVWVIIQHSCGTGVFPADVSRLAISESIVYMSIKPRFISEYQSSVRELGARKPYSTTQVIYLTTLYPKSHKPRSAPDKKSLTTPQPQITFVDGTPTYKPSVRGGSSNTSAAYIPAQRGRRSPKLAPDPREQKYGILTIYS